MPPSAFDPLSHPTFRTDNGFCSVKPDALHFSREAVRFPTLSRLSEKLGGRNRPMLGVSGAVLIIFGLSNLGTRNPIVDIIIICAGGFNLYRAVRTPPLPTYSITSTIPRDAIRSVSLLEPDPPRLRGEIVVRYDRDGETRQRTIVLEERSKDGFEEFDEAVSIMRDAGIPLS